MKYNEIGNTGMVVSELSFGASSLGGVFHSIKESEAHASWTERKKQMIFIQNALFLYIDQHEDMTFSLRFWVSLSFME